jgi:hypothetical protein
MVISEHSVMQNTGLVHFSRELIIHVYVRVIQYIKTSSGGFIVNYNRSLYFFM